MRHNRIVIFLHIVWNTWDRLPLIRPEFERRVHRFIAAVATDMRCEVIAIGGIEDHVHILLALPSTLTVAQLVKRMKGASSRYINQELLPEGGFKWQGTYSAFSVSRWDVPKIIEYIRHQREHHQADELWEDFEFTFDSKVAEVDAD